jgi:hypothetical protein
MLVDAKASPTRNDAWIKAQPSSAFLAASLFLAQGCRRGHPPDMEAVEGHSGVRSSRSLEGNFNFAARAIGWECQVYGTA